MQYVKTINCAVMVLFLICYSYQFFYIPVALFKKRKPHSPEKLNRIAVLIAARNEQSVIGQLIDSLKGQSYPVQLLDIYVGADNCTDATCDVARAHGAVVYERFDTQKVGKGYVLNFLLNKIKQSGQKYDAYVVLDADNIVDVNFITEINRVYCDGYDIVTCYRNSKNYGDNWISAGYALWFLREARYLNGARFSLGSSCAVSGTGFLFSERIIKSCGGWNFFLLTEDIEFSIYNITNGMKIGYAADAVIYDEQPVSFAQSWRQRLRWSRGYLQVFGRYWRKLLTGICRGSFSCFDMTMNIMPAAVLTGISTAVNLAAVAYNFASHSSFAELAGAALTIAAGLYSTMFVLGAITTATEWKNIMCPSAKKVLYVFTFPLFMLTYIPICIVSLFYDPGWKPITHNRCVNLGEGQGINRPREKALMNQKVG